MLLLLLLLLLVPLVVGSKKGVVPWAHTCTNSCLGKTTALAAPDMWMWTHKPWMGGCQTFQNLRPWAGTIFPPSWSCLPWNTFTPLQTTANLVAAKTVSDQHQHPPLWSTAFPRCQRMVNESDVNMQ